MKDKPERRILADRRLSNNRLIEEPFKPSDRIVWALRFIDEGKYSAARQTLVNDVLPLLTRLEAEGKI